MNLRDALLLADHASPAPTDAHAALLALRQALADALAMDVPELIEQSTGYVIDRLNI